MNLHRTIHIIESSKHPGFGALLIKVDFLVKLNKVSATFDKLQEQYGIPHTFFDISVLDSYLLANWQKVFKDNIEYFGTISSLSELDSKKNLYPIDALLTIANTLTEIFKLD